MESKYRATIECGGNGNPIVLESNNYLYLRRQATDTARAHTEEGKKWVFTISDNSGCPIYFLEGVVSKHETHNTRSENEQQEDDKPKAYTQNQADTLVWLFGIRMLLTVSGQELWQMVMEDTHPLHGRVKRLFYDAAGNKGGEIGKRIRRNNLPELDFSSLPEEKEYGYTATEASDLVNAMNGLIGKYLAHNFQMVHTSENIRKFRTNG